MNFSFSDSELAQSDASEDRMQELESGVSWVIPVRNESGSVEDLISGIRHQTVQPNEVIIVDGGSVDDTVSRLKELTVDLDYFVIIEAGDATPGLGRNIGIEAARYDWIALTDAGTVIPENWLEELMKISQSDSSLEVVYGHYEPIVESRFDEWAALSYIPVPVERGNGKTRGPVVPSSLLKKSVWQRVGKFPDLRASEDRIFMERIAEKKIPTGWAPEAVLHWHIQHGFVPTFKRFHLYSMHNVWAGRQAGWHYGVAKIYLILSFFLLLGIFHHPAWLIGLAAVWSARILKSIVAKRENRSLWWVLNPVRFLGVSAVMMTIDIAMFTGWIRAILSRNVYSNKHA